MTDRVHNQSFDDDDDWASPHHVPGAVDPVAGWLPTTPQNQGCMICGDGDVVWLHPMHPERVVFSVFGKQHVLNGFCCTCERCEVLLAHRDDEAEREILSLMVAQWPPHAGDGDGSAVQLLSVFRSADLGPRRFVPTA